MSQSNSNIIASSTIIVSTAQKELQTKKVRKARKAHSWSLIPYGKYKGMTWPQVAFRDPQYMKWAVQKQMFAENQLGMELRTVYSRMQRIRIPQDGNGLLLAEYLIFRDGHCVGMNLVRDDAEESILVDRVIRKTCIDLAYAAKCSDWSKGDSKELIRDVKRLLYPERVRWSQKDCESFFKDPNNFESLTKE